MKVGYLGPRGTFTEEAARRLYGLTDEQSGAGSRAIDLISYRTIPEILAGVETGEIDHGVVPIENSIEGSVAVTLDALVHDVRVQITGEAVLPVRHHLMARPDTNLAEIQTVLSHPQALAQCRKTLDQILPGVDQSAATSTAEAAQRVAKAKEPFAAVATELAAKLYGLVILRSDLQDFKDNVTRFISVGPSRSERTGFDKTSVVFAFGSDKPGNLYGALKTFADRAVNLTKLESRPAKRTLGDYIFFVDMEGYVDDPPVADALRVVRSQTAFFRVLGSYPRVEYPRPNGAAL